MTRILFLSKDELFEKVIELVLYNYDAEVKLVKEDTNIPEELKLFDVIVVDSDFNNNIKSIINNAVSLNKPVILLKNVFNEEADFSGYKDIIILPKPFEDFEFIDTLKNIPNLNLKLKDGEAVMSKSEKIKEVKKVEEKVQEEQSDNILDLTDIVEEAAEEVSDILSTKDKEDTADVSDIFSEKGEKKTADEVSDILSSTENKEETINLDEFDFSEPAEPSTSEETTKLEESGELAESEASIESLKPTESTSPLETTELKETAESTESAKSEDTLQPEQEIKKEVEKGVDTVSHEPKKEEIISEKEENLSKSEETQEEIFEEIEEKDEEDIKIPVDEETKKLAQEIENGEFEKEEDFPFKSEFTPEAHKPIDISLVEMKLLEASGKILEAIEEATVEIARGIAKVTPKIIEEVANEIIPKIAKKILTEELEKTKKK